MPNNIISPLEDEDRGHTLSQNSEIQLLIDVASYARKMESSTTPLQKP
jgi:hypothetical protein